MKWVDVSFYGRLGNEDVLKEGLEKEEVSERFQSQMPKQTMTLLASSCVCDGK